MIDTPLVAAARALGRRMLTSSGLPERYQRRFPCLGAIVMLHRVLPHRPGAFLNRRLQISPAHLEKMVSFLKQRRYRFVGLDQARDILRGGVQRHRPFVVFTFDDGYRDNYTHAYPLLRRHGVPFTVYVTTAFPERQARLWWYALEHWLMENQRVSFEHNRRHYRFQTGSRRQKWRAFVEIGNLMNGLEWTDSPGAHSLAGRIALYLGRLDLDDLCLSWNELREMARDPLVTIGAHTTNHPKLASLEGSIAKQEMLDSKALLEKKLDKQIKNFAYPFGSCREAGAREFRLAADCGFETAVTTRRGLLYQAHGRHLWAMPRIQVQGDREDLNHFDLMLSGLYPFVHNHFKTVVTV
jgi:peptidoglycan/xylan/chitin deacetylase (PgdA/CDA1 family)